MNNDIPVSIEYDWPTANIVYICGSLYRVGSCLTYAEWGIITRLYGNSIQTLPQHFILYVGNTKVLLLRQYSNDDSDIAVKISEIVYAQ